MNNMYGLVLFLVFITSMGSAFCDDANNEEIVMVVEDQMTMHDINAGTSMTTKANPVQTGIFLLEDGKKLKLSRKSFPGKNDCINLGQPCGARDWCCDPYYCTGYAWGTCVTTYCDRAGTPCGFIFSTTSCCGTCVANFCVG